MSGTDDVIHQWGLPGSVSGQGAARLVGEGERGRVGKTVGVEQSSWDNDRAVGFDNK